MSEDNGLHAHGISPFAVVNGVPLDEVPDDLYIPPDALEILLETFEGPLDLLHYLIKRQNIDILDIPIASITKQYVSYIDMMEKIQIELAAEYLVMAAMLAEIKSRLLLPRSSDSEQEEEDPRAELIRRLREYESFKKATKELDSLPRCGRDIFNVEIGIDCVGLKKAVPDVKLAEILYAFQDILRREEQLGHHHIQREPLSVRERMISILDRLKNVEFLAFENLFSSKEGKHGAVVSLLAILELCKEGLIDISQHEPLAELQVKPVMN